MKWYQKRYADTKLANIIKKIGELTFSYFGLITYTIFILIIKLFIFVYKKIEKMMNKKERFQ